MEQKIISIILIAVILLSLCSIIMTLNLNNSENSLDNNSFNLNNEDSPDFGKINLVVGSNSEDE